MTPKLGIIEGYFGPAWTWPQRCATMQALRVHGYSFFIYAPKADAYLRRRWREPYPPRQMSELAQFAAACKLAGVRFGVGLSPFEAYRNFDFSAQNSLAAKMAQLSELGLDDFALLFDDMHCDAPDLAQRQVQIIDFAAARLRAGRLIVCPSYYSDDPVLDRVFGARPPDYLETLGARLDSAIQIFWTGEEVCAREQSVGHLASVAERLRRKPFLWDNYPVNDGARMSQYLHLRAVTGRPAAICDYLAAHAINPALQPTLTQIPAITLAMSYAQGSQYAYGQAFAQAASVVLGEELAKQVRDDLLVLQDTGLDRLGPRKAELRARYAAVDHPAAREILAWLDGQYAIDAQTVQTQ